MKIEKLKPNVDVIRNHPLKPIIDQLKSSTVGDRFLVSDIPLEYCGEKVERIKSELEKETGRVLTVEPGDESRTFVVTDFKTGSNAYSNVNQPKTGREVTLQSFIVTNLGYGSRVDVLRRYLKK